MNDSVCFFERGSGPLVSILIPSRGNPTALRKAVESCINNAVDPSRIEIIIKVDDDDIDTCNMYNELATPKTGAKFKFVQTPRGRGYFEIHNWLNQMAAESSGDWLFILNDDAVIETEGWDELLCYCTVERCWHNCPQDVMLLWLSIPTRPAAIDFFLLRRKVFEITGHVCGSPHGDAWLKQVMQIIDCTATCGIITVRHERDPDRGERFSDNYHFSTRTIASVGANLRKIADASRLLAYIQEREIAPCWTHNPVNPGWQRWRKSADHDPRHVFVRSDGVVKVSCSDNIESTVSEMGGWWQARK